MREKKKKSIRNRRISVSYGRTFNLGDFESARINVGIERDLGPSEDAYTATEAELEELIVFVKSTKKKVKRN